MEGEYVTKTDDKHKALIYWILSGLLIIPIAGFVLIFQNWQELTSTLIIVGLLEVILSLTFAASVMMGVSYTYNRPKFAHGTMLSLGIIMSMILYLIYVAIAHTGPA